MRSQRLRDGLAGAAAAALALGMSELVSGALPGTPSLVESLGNWVIDVVPKQVKDWAIQLFGTNDKLALLVGITITTLLIGAAVGLAARKRLWIAIVVFSVFAIVASAAAARDAGFTWGDAVIPAGIAILTGLFALQWLLRLGGGSDNADARGESGDHSRRSILVGLTAVLGAAVLAGGFGRTLLERAKRIAAGRSDVVLPFAANPLPPVPASAEFALPDLATVITSNEEFYRIDTAFAIPRVDIQEWTLRVTGMVNRPYEVSFFDLLDMRMVERDVTLSCVSNEVGGNLVGNARWLGVPLTEILDRAGARSGAEQLVGRSVDGFTVGFPLEAAYDGREALVAVGMNDEPLPFEHGFPARLVVAGLYGYVSATKWLSEIELTRWDDFDAYWVPRGWSKEAPIKTQSRIDSPRASSLPYDGERMIAGVAWAPTRGISKVEVQIGADAPWVEAELSEPLSDNTWRQWKVKWDAEPGRYVIQVRATDGNGDTQTEKRARPAPNGATGWDSRTILIQG